MVSSDDNTSASTDPIFHMEGRENMGAQAGILASWSWVQTFFSNKLFGSPNNVVTLKTDLTRYN